MIIILNYLTASFAVRNIKFLDDLDVGVLIASNIIK